MPTPRFVQGDLAAGHDAFKLRSNLQVDLFDGNTVLREIPAAKWQNALMVLCHLGRIWRDASTMREGTARIFGYRGGNLMAALVSGQMSTFVEPLKVSWVLRNMQIYRLKLGRETSWWLVSICKCTNASRWKHSTVHTFCLTWPAAWIAWQEVAKRWGWAAVQVIPLKPWKKWMAKVAQLRRAQHVCCFFSGLGIECIYLVYSVGSESSFKESWHWMFRAWSKSDRVLSTWLLPLVQGVGVHWFISGPFQWRQYQLGSISRSYIHGDLENSWMTCTEDWKPLSLEITFPKVPAKVLGWSTRSRCQGLFMKVMKVSWKSFQSKYFWRTYWVLMVLFRFVWFF